MKKIKIIQIFILLFVPGLLFACNKTEVEDDYETGEQTEKHDKTYIL